MIREIVNIDEELCNGCGDCVPACHEGALQVIDGKVRLVSDLMCDGLGACIGHCPQGAITIEKREAEPYDEIKVMALMASKGKNTVIAHLKHLKEHNEREYVKQGVSYLRENSKNLSFDVNEVVEAVHNAGSSHHHGGGCPGSREMSFGGDNMRISSQSDMYSDQSELRQWPIQMHLVNPGASYFQNADVVLAADCVAYALGGFHAKYLKGKSLAIACPKLDSNQHSYLAKIQSLIDDAKINTLHVMIMQVPCCGGLFQLVKQAAQTANRKVPVKVTVVGLEGEILSEQWM